MIVLRFCFLSMILTLVAANAAPKLRLAQASNTVTAPTAGLSAGQLSNQNTTTTEQPSQKIVKKAKLLKSGTQKSGQNANPALRFTNDDEDDESEFRNFSGSLEVSRSNSLYDLENGSKYEGIDYVSNLIYKLKTGWITSQLGVSQDLNPDAEKQSVLNDTNITYVQKPFLLYKNSRTSTVTWSPSFTALIPISEKSQNVDHLQTALIASANLKVIAAEGSFWRGTGFVASLSYSQSFHRFETDVNGGLLSKNSSNQGLTGFFSRGDFTLTLSQVHRVRWTYQGDTKTAFDLTQDVSYAASKDWSVSIGHTNSASTLKPNGYDSNVSLIDEDTSIVYLGASYSF